MSRGIAWQLAVFSPSLPSCLRARAGVKQLSITLKHGFVWFDVFTKETAEGQTVWEGRGVMGSEPDTIQDLMWLTNALFALTHTHIFTVCSSLTECMSSFSPCPQPSEHCVDTLLKSNTHRHTFTQVQHIFKVSPHYVSETKIVLHYINLLVTL